MKLATIVEVYWLDIILVWIHVSAATFWIGGMLFLSLVVVPLLRRDPHPSSAQQGFISLARRFRTLTWVALALLIVTGGILLRHYISGFTTISEWPTVIFVKLTLVVLLVVVSLIHDRFLGPKVRVFKMKPLSELSTAEKLLLNLSPLIGRLSLLLGLGVLLAAVLMVRS